VFSEPTDAVHAVDAATGPPDGDGGDRRGEPLVTAARRDRGVPRGGYAFLSYEVADLPGRVDDAGRPRPRTRGPVRAHGRGVGRRRRFRDRDATSTSAAPDADDGTVERPVELRAD